ncbi:YncE family protein [Sorangium sp. So ce295]|uniref:YncE family protein n=1 Tax=Sorangium sp. So ce295 TaxID=3133295 RepID=UPI003F5D69AE
MSRNMRTLAAAALAAGCAPETVTQYDYEPYEGRAYPDGRTSVAIPAGGMGLVTDSLSDTVSLIDLGTGERFAQLPVGRDPVGVDGPHHVTVSKAGTEVFIALSYPVLAATGPHAQHGSSTQSGYVQKLSLDDLRILGQVRVDSNPGDIVVSEDGRRLVVSHFDLPRVLASQGDVDAARATLAVIDPDQVLPLGAPDPKRIPVCAAPHGVALSRPDGARAYVACYGEDALAVVDLDGGSVLERVSVSSAAGRVGSPSYGPYSAVLSPDGDTIAIGNTVSKDVRFFDVASGAIQADRTLSTQGAPFFSGWTPDGARLYVPTQTPDELLLIDTANGNVEVSRRSFSNDECVAPHVVEVQGSVVFLVCEGDHEKPGSVLRLDAVTLETLTSTEVGIYPDAIARVGGGGS